MDAAAFHRGGLSSRQVASAYGKGRHRGVGGEGGGDIAGPSTDFFWARKSDPAFWLMINGYGRPRHLAGIVGAFTHHAAEKQYGHAITKTYFDISSVDIGGRAVLLPSPERLEQFEQDPHLFY